VRDFEIHFTGKGTKENGQAVLVPSFAHGLMSNAVSAAEMSRATTIALKTIA
jgi:hypothetical protein